MALPALRAAVLFRYTGLIFLLRNIPLYKPLSQGRKSTRRKKTPRSSHPRCLLSSAFLFPRYLFHETQNNLFVVIKDTVAFVIQIEASCPGTNATFRHPH